MLHKISLLCRNRTGSQIFKQEIQRAGALPVGLLADGCGDNALSQHLQCGGDFVEGDDLWPKSGFFYGPAAAVDAGSREKQGAYVRTASQELSGERIALKFVIVIFQDLTSPAVISEKSPAAVHPPLK